MKRCFFATTQILLSLTALGKLVGAVLWSAADRAKDPIATYLSARELLVVAAALELLVAAMIWRARADSTKALAPLWLAAVFIIYRLELWRINFVGYCACLGYWAHWMRLSPAQVNTIAESIIGYMFVGSAAILLSHFLRRQRSADPASRQGGQDAATPSRDESAADVPKG